MPLIKMFDPFKLIPVMRGRGGGGMDTLLSVAVLSVESSCEVTGKPIKTGLDMGMLTTPTCVQVAPSADREPTKELPTRANRTQYGAVMPELRARSTAAASLVERYCMLTPLLGVT